MPSLNVSIGGVSSPWRGTFLGVYLPGIVSVIHIPPLPPQKGLGTRHTTGRDLGPGMPTPEKGPGTRHIHPTPKDLGSGTPLTDTYLWKQYLPTTSFAGGNNINETDWLVWADITDIHCNSWIEKPLIVKNKVNCTHGHMDWYVLVAKKPPALCLSLFSLEANS